MGHDTVPSSGSNITYICDPSRYAKLGLNISIFPFCDKKLSYKVRAKDLVSQMTLYEKVQQLGNSAYGVPRLGLPEYEWWSEGLHGVSNVGPGTIFDDSIPHATSFPTPILTTCFIQRVIVENNWTEARAMHNLGHAGLTFWSPTINVARDPRWGRIIETPGEDPFVIGTYAVNYVRGLQDVEGTEHYKDLNSRPLKVSATCKHFTAYDVDNWFGTERYNFDAWVTEQDMEETFNRPFQMCIQNGLNLDCGVFYTNNVENAVKQGKVGEAVVDQSLEYLYVVLMRLGLFDGNPKFNSLGRNSLCSNTNIKLATEAAREGIVLLMNDNETLPLTTEKFKTLAVVGPHANATLAMIGNYAFDSKIAGTPCRYTSPIDGFSSYGRVYYEAGCPDVKCNDESLILPAVESSKIVDATIIVAGIDLSIEAESLDRVDLLLPGKQTDLINQVADATKGPVVLVIMSAGGVDISFAKNNPKIQAILWVGYPGEEGGEAIADVVFGKYNPGGRLPLTWYEAEYVNKLPLTSMQLRPDDTHGYPGRTYKFFNGSTVFPFGYGLSYTKFNYTLTALQTSQPIKLNRFQHCRDLLYKNETFKPSCPAVLVDDLKCQNKIGFEIELKNVGNRDGNEVVLVYSQPPDGIVGTHFKHLIGFQRVFVAAGTGKKIQFTFSVCQSLAIVDYNGYSLLPSGGHTIIVSDGAISFPIQVRFH
nr:beta-xylosidase/alpha-l-arabinofuranosidase 2 [Quercus suber]